MDTFFTQSGQELILNPRVDVTVMSNAPPLEGRLTSVGEIVNTSPPFWLTWIVRVSPEEVDTVIVALLASVVLLSSALMVRVALPLPFAGETLHQDLSDDAVQSVFEVTVTDFSDAEHSNDRLDTEISILGSSGFPACFTVTGMHTSLSLQNTIVPVLSLSEGLASALKV